jgi:hypothetical protein
MWKILAIFIWKKNTGFFNKFSFFPTLSVSVMFEIMLIRYSVKNWYDVKRSKAIMSKSNVAWKNVEKKLGRRNKCQKTNIEKKCRRNKSRKMHISISDQNVYGQNLPYDWTNIEWKCDIRDQHIPFYRSMKKKVEKRENIFFEYLRAEMGTVRFVAFQKNLGFGSVRFLPKWMRLDQGWWLSINNK